MPEKSAIVLILNLLKIFKEMPTILRFASKPTSFLIITEKLKLKNYNIVISAEKLVEDSPRRNSTQHVQRFGPKNLYTNFLLYLNLICSDLKPHPGANLQNIQTIKTNFN